MPYSTTNGVRVFYEAYGEGPPIVLLHANPFDHRLFTYQIARWSNFHRLISIDMRGYGRSDKPETPFTMKNMSEDVLGVCAQEGVERAVFVGVSTGSGISLMLGLMRPDLAQAIVLVGGSSRGGAGMQRRIDGFLSGDLKGYQLKHLKDCTAPGFSETKLGAWLLNMFNEDADRLSPASIAQIFRARMQCDMHSQLSDMRVPTLVVNGEFDGSLPSGKETAARIPGAHHAVIKGAGHCCNLEDPAAFDEVVIAFLAQRDLWRGPINSLEKL